MGPHWEAVSCFLATGSMWAWTWCEQACPSQDIVPHCSWVWGSEAVSPEPYLAWRQIQGDALGGGQLLHGQCLGPPYSTGLGWVGPGCNSGISRGYVVLSSHSARIDQNRKRSVRSEAPTRGHRVVPSPLPGLHGTQLCRCQPMLRAEGGWGRGGERRTGTGMVAKGQWALQGCRGAGTLAARRPVH